MGRTSEKYFSVSQIEQNVLFILIDLFFSHSRPEDKARVMTCALKVIQQTIRENGSSNFSFSFRFRSFSFSFSANPNKHMRIQDTFHPDGISYDSGDELSESESDYRSSQEKLNLNGSSSSNSPASDLSSSSFFFFVKIVSTTFSFAFSKSIWIEKISNGFCSTGSADEFECQFSIFSLLTFFSTRRFVF